jgi:hypothetical protein
VCVVKRGADRQAAIGDARLGDVSAHCVNARVICDRCGRCRGDHAEHHEKD